MSAFMTVSENPGGRSVDVGGLLFDSDGVLVDSDASALHAWATWAEERGLDPKAVVDQVHGRRAEDTVALLVKGPERDEALRRINDLELAAANEVRALPGALVLLRGLEGRPWAVVTSATAALAEARLQAAGLPAPPVLVTADDVEAGKPAPDGYRAAAARLGRPTSECVVFEDSDAGVLAAHAAEVGVVVGVNLRSASSRTWARVPDLDSVSCQALVDGRLRLTVRAPRT
jgi:sugar-phosphatase